jgi:uncharacterized protein (DUF362 family)
MKNINRREFIQSLALGGVALGLPALTACTGYRHALIPRQNGDKPVVSIVSIKNGKIDYAVHHAIDLIGGIDHIAAGKQRILIKPNLVSPEPYDVTNPAVVKALVRLMKASGRDVSIGEGSAVGPPNFRPQIFGGVCRTKDVTQLNQIQQFVFDSLGYTDLGRTLKTPLINLHTGEMTRIPLPGGFVYKELVVHQALADADLICSVPMMKTHGLATVTLGMKNMFGTFPGQVYGTVRSAVHRSASEVEPSGTASAIVDKVRANTPGLVVIDASTAMQGQGPSVHMGGQLIKTQLIIAGTNPLAADMVAANVMGFQPKEISTFVWAWKAGLTPLRLADIEIRGKKIGDVRRPFMRPMVVPWAAIRQYGPPC